MDQELILSHIVQVSLDIKCQLLTGHTWQGRRKCKYSREGQCKVIIQDDSVTIIARIKLFGGWGFMVVIILFMMLVKR